MMITTMYGMLFLGRDFVLGLFVHYNLKTEESF